MTILSIETSCDETSIALVEAGGTLRQAQGKTLRFKVLKNIVSSQIPIHRPFGGVVPNLAKREHLKNLPLVLRRVFKSKVKSPCLPAGRQKSKVNYIAVTVGPGLEPALWTGINFVKELSEKWHKPLIGVNHMEGHLYSNWLPIAEVKSPKIIFPAIALIVSGGHTILLNMKGITKWIKLGETLDDAAGEAFDKVARMLNLPYPGGPEIQKLASKGNPRAIAFPRPMLNQKNFDFSFSGLKTSILYYLRDNPKTNKADIAASFQQAVIDVLVKKTIRAAEEYNAKSVLLCGGVSANKLLRESLHRAAMDLNIQFTVPDFAYNTDNAAMVAAAAYINLLAKKTKLPIEANGNLTI